MKLTMKLGPLRCWQLPGAALGWFQAEGIFREVRDAVMCGVVGVRAVRAVGDATEVRQSLRCVLKLLSQVEDAASDEDEGHE